MSEEPPLRKAFVEAIVNGLVMGAIVAGAMIGSSNFSMDVILRTTTAVTLLRFSFYMFEQDPRVTPGRIGKLVGLGGRTGDFLRRYHFGKVI